MRHAVRSHRRSPARYVIWAGLLAVLTTLLTVAARWVWAHPNTASWALIVVLLPTTLAGERWSRKEQRNEHANRHRG